ncbi:CU044_5270 family protein [Arthrobacter sp. zg-Y769]|uniref:CU044_5270 family protein n=1 Tax=Arthrobacter sp. zg-Y769 TaxID=2894191 RepID=UPI001E499AE2|nr:CU044_5270 family protein [Arthrobacter sp. zg-Y769]MCC9204998.1 CU044_5270 family protein [Arthrobacter sp. zg-Y769]
MSKTSMPGGIERLLQSVDPGHSVSEAEVATSRARSLSVMSADARAEGTTVTRLASRIPPHTTSRGSRPRVRRRLVLASAAAALLVGGIVIADVVRPNGPGATAEAAEVLNDAAEATIRTSDPLVGPGQYLKIETKALTYGGMQAADGSDISWQETVSDQLYIPADKEAEWVWDRGERIPLESSSDAAKAAAAETAKLLQKGKGGLPNPTVGIQRAPGGAFYGTAPMVIIGTSLQDAGSLPRDPQALLDLIYERTKGANKTPERAAFVTIADGLRTGAVPADLRAAMYKAAALIPGVVVGDRQATVDGRTGIAIGLASPEGTSRDDIIIDPATGLVIGEQDVLLKDFSGSPAGTVSSWTSVQTSVVDSAP